MLRQLAILIVATCEIAATDLLESFRPREENPPELNDFLASVLEHQSDFEEVKEAAIKYQKMAPPPTYNDFFNLRKMEMKRNAPHRKMQKTKHKKSNRHRRHLPVAIYRDEEDKPKQKLKKARREEMIDRSLPSKIYTSPEGERIERHILQEVLVEPEAEKGTVERRPKAVAGVHRTYKANKMKQLKKQMKKSEENRDFYYVDLGQSAENEQEKRSGMYPHHPQYYYRNRPGLRIPVEKFDYPVYESEPLHHTPNDEVAFEKALSYEIEPKEPSGYNDPEGNNLYSVDEGREDFIQPLTPQGRMMEGEDVTNERFFIDSNNNLRKSDNSLHSVANTTSSTITTSLKAAPETVTPSGNGVKIVKQVGQGFIEITKNHRLSEGASNLREDTSSDMVQEPRPVARRVISARENEEKHFVPRMSVEKREEQGYSNAETVDEEGEEEKNSRSGILSKNSLHPLRLRNSPLREEEMVKFQSRKLQFLNDRMMDNEDEDYDYVPRKRRDFLDALGMKNEEDYSEDNPYKDIVTDNNTDVNNDTFIQNLTSKCTTTSTVNPTSDKCVQKQDMNTIKQILEEPKEAAEQTTVGNFKQEKEKEKKRSKKNAPQIYEETVPEDKNRPVRDASSNLKTKILQNKDRIYNKEEEPGRNYNYYGPVKRELRQQPWFENRPNLKIKNDIKKSLPGEETVTKGEEVEAPDILTTTAFYNYTENNEANVNSTYEKVAYQMDMENEKLAQVVNGHLASQIVSTVFDLLKANTALKTKFYPGLSRKHVDYAGTIDFDIFKANETEDVNEARLLLDQITKVLNKLVWNQVRRKLCQRLPDELKEYLEVIVNIKSPLPAANFEENKNQGSFLFQYQEKSSPPPFDVKRLQEILTELEGLLLSYHNLNSECQNRVEPIKDFIERHVKVLKKIVSCPDHNCETKRNTNYDPVLIQRQLESVGLRKNELQWPVKKMKNSSWQKRDTEKRSEKYKKLQMAADKIREKREYERKIAEMFGKERRKRLEFEKPVVYSLG